MDGITEPDDQNTNEDPRTTLTQWANKGDEWIRRIVRQVLGSYNRIPESEQALIYRLLLEEKGIDNRTLSTEPLLGSLAQPLAQPEPFHLVRVSNVRGVNALVEGEQIDFRLGLTLLYGENGTGKTGYARILKWMAGSRSAEDILSDVNLEDDPPPPSADIDYRLGGSDLSYHWSGERAQLPFTLMSIFDNPSARFHVDDGLPYTYRPASLAFFDRANLEVQNIGELIEKELKSLTFDNSPLLRRFDSRSDIYPYIESLGPATDLQILREFLTLPENAAEQENELTSAIAALRANVVGQQISLRSRYQSALKEALSYSVIAESFKIKDYNDSLTKLSELFGDQVDLRDSLFAAADLPAEPDQTWEAFIRSGQDYRGHLESLGVHDGSRCLYCRQILGTGALGLIAKYSEYLESQIAKGIEAEELTIQSLVKPLRDTSLAALQALFEPADADTEKGVLAPDDRMEALQDLVRLGGTLRDQFTEKVLVDDNTLSKISEIRANIGPWLTDVEAALEELRAQNSDREKSLLKKEKEFLELKARLELNRSWGEVESIVAVARRHNKLVTERTAISNIRRNITILSNKASEYLINGNFEEIFRNECAELRAPQVEIEFAGREGQSQRKKTLAGGHSPSKVLSEGEQKALAIADFIAETKMSDNSVPVIFDDPVSSLDHRRVGEVAGRIAALASQHQVVVFTHDILLVTNLLTLLENSDRCVYYRVTDDNGKGTVTLGTGPRWDTLRNLATKINLSIEEGKKMTGEERESLVRDAYDSIRSWCELFVEQEVFAKVTERFQPNVRMTALKRIKIPRLEQTIETVFSVFEEACRYIDAHSQPLPTLGAPPKLSDLESDWEKLRKCRSEYNKDEVTANA